MVDPSRDGGRVAFFGGSFDPPHCGHLGVARAAQIALDLDTVLFAPVGTQPLKPQGSTASFKDRVAMTKLAIEGDGGFKLSLIDAPNGARNYTIETLSRLRHELRDATILFCLMGADSFLGLRQWHRGSEVPFAAQLIVASRPGQKLEDLTEALPAPLTVEKHYAESRVTDGIEVRTFMLRDAIGATAPFYLLPGLEIEISASEIRSQVQAARGRLCDGHHLLPDTVCEYIAEHGLYR